MTAEHDAGHAGQASFIYASLQERILSGEIPQGERLVVRTYGTEYKTSDLPVREALRRLEGDGLVETSRNRGARVITLRPDDIPGVFLVRGELEALATELAGPHLTKKDFETLDELMAEMAEVANSAAHAGYSRLNHIFHSVIFARCPYPLVKSSIDRIWAGNAGFGLVFSLDAERIRNSLREHAQIVEHLQAGRWCAAGDLARAHKHATAISLLESLDIKVPERLAESQALLISTRRH